MIKTNTNSKKGFTIIEVVLVLAIAGLIFLMVFLALPAMQASQRDTQRRNDLSLFASQLTQYSANNRGKVPTVTNGSGSATDEWAKFVKSYLAKPQEKDNEAINATATPEGEGFYFEDPNNNSFVDPDGTPYGWKFVKELNNADSAGVEVPTTKLNHIIYIYSNAECDGELAVPSTGKRKVAFQYKLEGSGVYCGHN